MKVGLIGVGAMGVEMSRHIVKAGFEVLAYDLDQAAIVKAVGNGAVAANDLAQIATDCDMAIIMVATDPQTRAVVDGLLAAGIAEGFVVVVGATSHPKTMIELATVCATRGVDFVDAPVCYGLQGAIKGDLIVLCGGEIASIDRVRSVLRSYSRSIEHLGPVGTGQLGKACNNMMHWAACVANYETLALAKACGIDAQTMRETLLKCPARNTTLERWDTTRFTWHEKDMDVALDVAQLAGLGLPLFGAVDQLVKRLGPDDVRALLHENEASYLGLPINVRPLSDVVM